VNFDLLTFKSCHVSCVTWSTLLQNGPWLSILELWRPQCDRLDNIVAVDAYALSRNHNTLGLKKCATWCKLMLITLANVDRFSKFFHQLIRKKILYVQIAEISTFSAICSYTTLWNSKIQKNVTDFDSILNKLLTCFWVEQLNVVQLNIVASWWFFSRWLSSRARRLRRLYFICCTHI